MWHIDEIIRLNRDSLPDDQEAFVPEAPVSDLEDEFLFEDLDGNYHFGRDDADETNEFDYDTTDDSRELYEKRTVVQWASVDEKGEVSAAFDTLEEAEEWARGEGETVVRLLGETFVRA